MHKPEMIDQAIKPMLLTNVIIGMGIFENSNKFFTKCLEFIYVVCYVLMFACIFWYSYQFFATSLLTKWFVSNRIVFDVSFVATGIMITFLMVERRINAKKTRKLIKLFNEYDRAVEKMDIPRRYRTIYRYQLYNFAFVVLHVLIYSMILYLEYSYVTSKIYTQLILMSFNNFPLLFVNVSIVSFCTWIRCLRLKFQELNDLLQSLRSAKSDLSEEKRILTIFYDFENKRFNSFEDENVRRSKRNVTTMRTVKQAHLELIKIADAINAAYGMQLLMLIFIAFVFLINFLYIIYRITCLDIEVVKIVKYAIPTLFVTSFFVFEIIAVSNACVTAINEVASTGEIICKLYEPSTSKEFQTEIRDFTLQLNQHPLKFTACGFFIVDNSFIPSITQSIFMYLVILVQVSDMSIQLES